MKSRCLCSHLTNCKIVQLRHIGMKQYVNQMIKYNLDIINMNEKDVHKRPKRRFLKPHEIFIFHPILMNFFIGFLSMRAFKIVALDFVSISNRF